MGGNRGTSPVMISERPQSNSEAQGRFNPKLVVMLVATVLLVIVFGRSVLTWKSADPVAAADDSPNGIQPTTVFTPSLTLPITVVVTATPTPTPEATSTPWIVERVVTVEVTSVSYVQSVVQSEVTRIVEVYPTPSATPSLPPDRLRLCLYVEGVTGVFVNDAGVAGNQCYEFSVTSPVNDFRLRITN